MDIKNVLSVKCVNHQLKQHDYWEALTSGH